MFVCMILYEWMDGFIDLYDIETHLRANESYFSAIGRGRSISYVERT